MSNTLVSVLMPAYNSAPFVAQAVESVLHQTYTGFEFIIINDGSTDATAQAIEKFTDPRICFVNRSENLGIIATLNEGLALCRGRYIARMDSDDICLPQRLMLQVAHMEQHPELAALGSSYIRFGAAHGNATLRTGAQMLKVMTLFGNPLAHPTTMLRSDVLRTHQFNYQLEYPHAEDYRLWTQLMQIAEIDNLPQPLLKYRVHEGQVSALHAQAKERTVEKIQRQLLTQLQLTPGESQWHVHRALSGGGTTGSANFATDAMQWLILVEKAVLDNQWSNHSSLCSALGYVYFRALSNAGGGQRTLSALRQAAERWQYKPPASIWWRMKFKILSGHKAVVK